MKKSLKLNNQISVDLDRLIQSRMVILANSGSGKSWAIRRIAEQSIDKLQTIIIDPEGEFSSLREKHDLILCGKDADVPVEVRSAALLATKLLELNKSAVLDLYELHPQERQRFVKLFCDALVNCPKALYHPVLIILDEAHDYVPEGKPSEATYSVEALASKGRKRGQCLILASQRISKLSKNASAECNNKLIGRASQDIDYLRAGAELGFAKSDSAVKLRNLKPGEFFAYGPAISDEVVSLKIGDVETTHEKIGYKETIKVPPASDAIRKVLADLKDLPQEAEKEARTVQELKKENAELKHKLSHNKSEGKTYKEILVDIEAAVKKAEHKKDIELFKWQTEWQKQVQNWFKIIISIGESMREFKDKEVKAPFGVLSKDQDLSKPMKVVDSSYLQSTKHVRRSNRIPFLADEGGKDFEQGLGKCSKAIASFLYGVDETGSITRPLNHWTKTQVAVAVGYSQNSGGFNNSISELCAAGLVVRDNGRLRASHENISANLIIPIDLSLEKWLPKLGGCARKIWELMLSASNDSNFTKQSIADATGYSVTSGGFNNSISELSSLGLVERSQGGNIRINPEILNL